MNTIEEPTISDYSRLTVQFSAVRRSWKRMNAASGLAIVITESIGILAVLILLDWLYQPRPMIRVGMWVPALAGIAWLFIRHVLAPLLRKIPDEQIALYIEEHRADLDGVLITAAEYGGRQEQSALIDAVIAEALARTTVGAVARVVDLTRLKKYAMAAIACVGIFVVAAILFPDTLAHRFGRVLNPWRPTAEDIVKPGPAPLAPMSFALSKGDVNLVRGASFELGATLSRAADKPVTLHFRPRTAGAEWKSLGLTEIEKLNGFQGTLPDVSEDLEYYVACGADKSGTHRISVFDPLVVRSLEVITHYPAYTKLPDLVEAPSDGDVTALIGSTITVRIQASTPLKDGQVKWSNGQTQKVTVDPQSNTTAAFSFKIKEDATYDYAVSDVNGQQAFSAASLSVHAIPDTPPSLTVESPEPTVQTHRLGEVDFRVEAKDDFGIEGVDLVSVRLDEQGQPHETRVPLVFDPADAARASYRLMLEDASPPFNPPDAIFYHLEARDFKGQKASSAIGFIVIGFLESWSTWDLAAPPGGVHIAKLGLMDLQSLNWQLHIQKANLPPKDFQKQAKEIADQVVDAKGNMLSFVDLVKMPQLAPVADKIAAHVKKAHQALTTFDTAKAAVELGVAAALYAGNSLLEDKKLAQDSPPPTSSLAVLEKARIEALDAAEKEKTHREKEESESQGAEAANKAIDALVKKQEEIIDKAKTGEPPKDVPQPKDGKDSKSAELANKQREIATQTKAAADKAKSDPTAGAKLKDAASMVANAAKTMQAAAHDFEKGKNAEGEAKASKAKSELEQARSTLRDTSRDKLEAAVSKAESQAAALLAKQRQIRADTERAAKELDGGKTPDQRQKRDLEKQAVQQTGLGGKAETLSKEINDLTKWAAAVGEPGSIRSLTEAERTGKRARPESKMANAAIDLSNSNPSGATGEQKKAEDALEKIVKSLQDSSDALAATRDAQIRRAARAAAEVKKGLEQLSKKEPDKSKPDKGPAPDPKDRHAAAQKTAADIKRLAKGLDQRGLAPPTEVKRLTELSQDTAKLEAGLTGDPKLVKEVTELVATISDTLEKEREVKTQAGKLFSSQREECPPAYRQFVNKYFEALSQVARPPEPGKKP